VTEISLLSLSPSLSRSLCSTGDDHYDYSNVVILVQKEQYCYHCVQ